MFYLFRNKMEKILIFYVLKEKSAYEGLFCIYTYTYIYTIVIHNEAHFMLIYDIANSISAIGCRSIVVGLYY